MVNYQFDHLNSDRISQSLDLINLASPKQDNFLLNLGKYIADGINSDYIKRFPQEIAIREIIDYDAINIDISRFPLLKLYRQTDEYLLEDGTRQTKAIIAYCLTYPEQNRLPGLMKYMSKAINIMLDNYYYNHEQCSTNVMLANRSAEYRIMVSEVTNSIYPFLRFNFSFQSN